MLLVTTPLEKSWGKDEKICFLGTWCCLYSRKDVWGKRNHEVMPYHWDDRQKAFNDFQYLQSLNKTLLQELTPILNNLHGTNYSVRSWNLLIGYWLTQFTSVILDRWTMIDRAVKQHDNLETIVFSNELKDLAPNDTREAGEFFVQDEWNHVIYNEIIRKCTDIQIIKQARVSLLTKVESLVLNSAQSSLLASSKSFIKRVISKLSSFTIHNNAYFFSSTGLRPFALMKLHVSLGLFPTFVRFPDSPIVPCDSQFRKWELDTLETESQLEKIIRLFLPMCMPKTYLEGFLECRKIIKKIKLPKSPKVIFTSNDHFSNDLFKIWAIDNLEKGARLVIGQHGGGAFHKFNGGTSFELRVCDSYITTGKGNNVAQYIHHVGRFNNKLSFEKYDKNGVGILMAVAMPRYSFDLRAMVIAGQMNSYFKNQFSFYTNLRKSIQKKLNVRIYPDGDYGWEQKKRWADHFPFVLLDEATSSIDKQVKKCRLVISTYNATTYNETLANNIPTVIYWDTTLWEISSVSLPYFEELKKVGIFHDTPESAARHINNIWDDISLWWKSSEVQTARNNYCEQYASISSNMINKLESSLRKEMKLAVNKKC
jgi:putative transferase (TIGR04331 family)